MRSPEGAVPPLRRARLHDRCVGGRLRLRLQAGPHQRELALVLGLRLLHDRCVGGRLRLRLHAGPLLRELCKMLLVALVLGLRLLGLSMLSPRLLLCLRRSDRGRRASWPAAGQLVVRPVTALHTALGRPAPGCCWRVFGAWRRKKWFVDVTACGLLAEEMGEDEA